MSRSTLHTAAILLVPLAATVTLFALPPPAPADRAVDLSLPTGSEALAAALPATPVAQLAPVDCPEVPAAAHVAAPEPPPPVDPGAAVLLHGRQLVLATLPDMTWSTGQPTIKRHADGFTVAYDLARAVVPPGLQAQAGARFTVYAGDGSSCQAEAGTLAIHSQMDGVFAFDEAAPTRAELRETASAMNPEDHVVQAALRGDRRCTGVWARRADLPAPIVFARAKVTARERAEVRGLLDAHPAVVALHAEYAEYHAAMPAEDAAAAGWPAFLDRTLELAAWTEIGGDRRYITAQVGSEEDGCGGFGERAAAVFLRDGAALVAQPGPGFLDPLAVMDIDRDGVLEAVTEGGRSLESRAEPSALTRRYEFPYLGCGC